MFERSLFLIIALALVLVFVPIVGKLAKRIGLTDKPDADQGGRKDHKGEIPLIGGLVIFPVFIGVSILAGFGFDQYWPLYSALSLLLLVGAVDDKVHLHFWVKFGLQFVAAALVVLPGGAQLYDLGNLFGLGVFDLGLISVIFSVVSVVLLINAINLMDGLDGLAGGVSFIILGWLLVACILAGELVFHGPIMILMACVLGFLFYNKRAPWRSKASVFLGDAGSMCLGLMVGWFAIHLASPDARVIEPMAVAWVLALPIWDECAQFYRRVREGRHPFSPDRGHFHHHFITAGLSAGRSVLIVWLVVFISGAIGVLGLRVGVPLPVLTITWILGILAHMWFSDTLENYPRVIQKIFVRDKI